MSTVLVVDDSATELEKARRLLVKSDEDREERLRLTVLTAENGHDALKILARESVDVVVTDMRMPEMDGLELVKAIRSTFPLVPVVVMTAYGNEEIAVQALRLGAASYVPKKILVRELLHTVDQVLVVARGQRDQERIQRYIHCTESHLILENDPTLVPPLLAYLRDNLTRLKFCDETGLIRVTMALGEALVNAMQHGNLEASSDLRQDDDRAYQSLIDERRAVQPYRDRRVYLTIRESPTEVHYIIRDEGKGFDPHALPDPTDPLNLEKASGRGLLLIRTFMDHVAHNATGNEIHMIKRREERRTKPPTPPEKCVVV